MVEKLENIQLLGLPDLKLRSRFNLNTMNKHIYMNWVHYLSSTVVIIVSKCLPILPHFVTVWIPRVNFLS